MLFILGAVFGVIGMGAWLFGSNLLTAVFTLLGIALMVGGVIRNRLK